MRNPFNFPPVQQALTTAQEVLVVLPQKANFDQTAAALALFLSLNKMGKKATVACAEEMKVAFSSLVGVDKITRKLSGNHLVVSFDYVEEAVEKVSYNIDQGKFNLVIQPREGASPLSTDKVEYSYSGNRADLIFVIGSSSLNDLGPLYQESKTLFDEGKMVSLGCQANHRPLGRINLVDSQASSCSEIVAALMARLNWPVDADIADNLFQGLRKATNNFSSPRTTPTAFEGAAFCLRAGARQRGAQFERPKKEMKAGPELKPMPTEVSAEKAPSEVPSPDWFEPKIFKGQTRV